MLQFNFNFIFQISPKFSSQLPGSYREFAIWIFHSSLVLKEKRFYPFELGGWGSFSWSSHDLWTPHAQGLYLVAGQGTFPVLNKEPDYRQVTSRRGKVQGGVAVLLTRKSVWRMSTDTNADSGMMTMTTMLLMMTMMLMMMMVAMTMMMMMVAMTMMMMMMVVMTMMMMTTMMVVMVMAIMVIVMMTTTMMMIGMMMMMMMMVMMMMTMMMVMMMMMMTMMMMMMMMTMMMTMMMIMMMMMMITTKTTMMITVVVMTTLIEMKYRAREYRGGGCW